MNYIFVILIVLQTAFTVIVVDMQEDRITELEYNLAVANTELLLYKSLPPLETK